MNTLRRTIHPAVRVLDEKSGLVEYVASSESLDAYNEIIRADGWMFDDFQKNAPFVDSHNYSSIDCLLGKVVDFKVSGSRLIETVQWAIDVPSNLLAQKGFEMTAAGYLKAVSVGFMPVETVTPYDRDRDGWRENCEALGIDPDGTQCRCIYTQQQQKELSACVLGANPDALANVERALHAGILNDSDISKFSRLNPNFGREFEKRTHSAKTYSFGNSSRAKVIERIDSLIKVNPEPAPQPTPAVTAKETDELLSNFSRLGAVTRREFEGIEKARRGGNMDEIGRAVQATNVSLAQERRAAYGDPVEKYLSADPERRYLWNGIVRMFARSVPGRVKPPKLNSDERAAVVKTASGINLQDTFGTGLLLAIPVADELYDLILNYGQYKYLGLRKMVGAYTKFAEATSFPNAVFLTPTMQGGNTSIPDDVAYTGTQVTPDANTIATIIKASLEWVQDETVDYSNVIVSKVVQGLAARIDYGAFAGNGNNDITNGMEVGIFNSPKIKAFITSAAKTTIQALERSDFISVVSLVSAEALRRMDVQPPRWYIHPSLIPQLLTLWDGMAHNYLLKTPAETHGDWTLIGFPVTWASQAPTGPGAALQPWTAIAFGNPDAYIVALQERFEFTTAKGGAEFADVSVRIRATARGQSMLREAAGFATMQLPLA